MQGDASTLDSAAIQANAAALGVVIEACADQIAVDRRRPEQLGDRLRRDLLTMAAHVLGARTTYQMTGQLLLGADTPFSVF